jgi:hypothetical protein
MKAPATRIAPAAPALTNGSGAAALLAAGIGSFALAVLAIAADKSAAVKAALAFYKPTGALSGVSTVAILLWLLIWVILDLRWRKRTVGVAQIFGIACVLLVLSFLLTFPPIADIF